nr:chondroitinase-B domain-containing protein [Pleurocapsa sp. MO_226.B13]
GDAEGDTISNIKNLIGSDEDDTLIGDDRDNILEGIEGDDLVQGNDGNDRLYGGEDDDTIEGGSGADLLQGNEDDDYLSGGANNDTIFGGEDDDTIEGGGDLNFLSGDAGDDSLIGGTVNDTLLGGFDNDTLFGDAGIDTLDGGSENDFLDGGEDNDLLTGATGDDTLIGGEGDDIINGGFGIDSLAGGSGADIFEYNELQDSTLDRGIDRIEDLEIGSDVVAVPEVIAGTEVPPLGAVDNLDEASIASVLTDDTFAANTAVTFTEGERTFLAINDGNDGFSASNDGLIEITGFSGDLADFSLGNSNQITDVPTQSASLPDSSLPQTEVPWQNEELDPQQIFIEDASQIQDAIANANPGDTLILKNGVYENLSVYLNQSGITFRPETAGGVTITGDSDIYIESDYITVSGFQFDEITSGDLPIVHFVGANYSRFTNNAFSDTGVDPKDRTIVVQTDSRYNQIDYNFMDNNLSIGIAIIGTRDISDSRDNVEQVSNWYNRIENNYIRNIPYPGGDVNGREAIQLGQLISNEDLGVIGRSVVESNLFENVDYDPEVVSVKTNENIVRNNTIDSSENGGLVVRAGDDNLIEGNFIFDARTGIRFNGSDNQIINNYIEGGDRGLRYNPTDPSTNVTIANNTIVNTEEFGIIATFDAGTPASVNIDNNIWQSNDGILIDSSLSLVEAFWKNNIVWTTEDGELGTLPPAGVTENNPWLVNSGGIERLSPNSPAVDAGISVPGVNFDIDRQLRNNQIDIGADERSTAPINNQPLTPSEVGAFWTEGEPGKNLSTNTGEILSGSSNNDYLDASGGRENLLLGRGGNDEIIFGKNNIGFGGDGNDYLEAKYGTNNFIIGGNGNDQIIVVNNNFASGGNGDDLFDAKFSSGGSVLVGGKGNDEFLMGTNDSIFGGQGSDRFFTYFGGNNTITGGAGADEFWLANGQIADSPNIITDFELGTDVIGISGLNLTFSNLNLMQEGEDTIVAVGDTQLAVLQGVKTNDLSKTNFSFT